MAWEIFINFVDMKGIKEHLWLMAAIAGVAGCLGCGASKSRQEAASTAEGAPPAAAVAFDRDSAYSYVAAQVGFGPRVPNTPSHRAACKWLASELRRHGAEVIEQPMRLTTFDNTVLDATNIMGRYNTASSERLLLLAHWDCRPWADEDPDESKRSQPVDGANDGASGVGVLLEIARQLGRENPAKGVDILFVDAEDWGTTGQEDSWALGAQYFAAHPPVEGYSPREAILLDMVGGHDARFYREYFSERAAGSLNASLWGIADSLGYGEYFPDRIGTAVTDDHVQLIQAGIPAVDVIEFSPSGGFNSRWHTSSDNMEGISAETLGRVGETVMTYIRRNY